jgi:heme-degrading monooxygenase HmoA
MSFPCPTAGAIAVIFVSQRTDDDAAGYDAAATEMEALAARQPGYLGFVAARGADGVGIAVSYWQNDAAARAWRDQPDHARIRDMGRTRWYDAYALSVATVERSYDWRRDTAA